MAGKVLLVESDSDFRGIINSVLRNQGYRVVVTGNGTDGIKKAIREIPDIILLELVLPDMSGVEVTSRLKTHPLTRHVPVIICTAYLDEGPRNEALQRGAAEILTKPVTSVDLLKILRRYLRTTPADTITDHERSARANH